MSPLRLVDLVRGQVQKLDSHLPLYDVKTLATQIDESLTQERLVAWLCTAFGLLATLLAALGLYGVLGVFRGPTHARDRHSAGSRGASA